MPYRIAYVGNFRPPHSTENHVAEAMRALGHQVLPLQEDSPTVWAQGAELVRTDQADVVWWTKTWTFPGHPQWELIEAARMYGVPVVGFHLDLWFGLDRAAQVLDEPFFRGADLMVTADGGHPAEWEAAKVNHWWQPPAVARSEAERVGHRNPVHRRPIVFVGTWQGDRYHAEHPHRRQLIDHLRARYRGQLGLYPQGRSAIRGQELADLYATAQVVVGDSCLAPTVPYYWSDRIPETLGRGGLLLHPYVPGMDEHLPADWIDRCTWDVGDWAALDSLIGYWLRHHDERAEATARWRRHIMAGHLYEHRVGAVLAEAERQGLLGQRTGADGVTVVRDGRTGRPGRFVLRPDTSDSLVVREVWTEGVYPLAPEHVQGRTVVDLGANVGAFTVWAAAHGAWQVHAYEPHPDNLAQLRQNLAANQLPEALVQAYGVAVLGLDKRQAGTLVPSTDTGGHQVHPRQYDGGAGSPVPTESLLEVLTGVADGSHPTVLKVDTEGAEWDFMLGPSLPRLLQAAHVERLVMEWHHGTEGRIGQLVQLLLDWGHVDVFGHPAVGGNLHAWRYDL